MVIAIDSNVFIYHFERHPEFYQAAIKAFNSLQGENRGITSIISLIELLSLPQTNKDLKNLQSLYATIPNLTTLDVNQEIALESARISGSF